MNEMKNNKLEQAFKNIAKTATEARPALQCLHVDKTGYAVVTDAHRLLKIDGYKPADDASEYNLNLMSFQLQNEIFYPDTERIIPKKNDLSWWFSIETVKKLATFFKPFKVKKNYNRDIEYIAITCKEYYITFTAENGATITVECSQVHAEYDDTCKNMNMHVQGGYLNQAFEFFKDYGTGVTVGYGGDLRPLVMKVNDAIYMVTPVRKF